MSITVKRVFYPVGQGAFYSERFYDENNNIYNMIYDCGTLFRNNDFLLNNIIEQELKNVEIDCLYISHFHKDHISGIENLIQKNKIKRILVPYLSIEEILVNEIYLIKNFGFDSYIVNFFNSIYIQEDEEIKKEIKDKKISVIIIKENHSDSIKKDDNNVWFFESYVSKKDPQIYKEFIYSINSLLGKKISVPVKPKDLLEFLKKDNNKNFDDLCEKFKECFKNLNSTSIVLYSGSQDSNQNFKNIVIPKECIYFGDFNINTDKKVLNFIKNFCDIGCIQIPHHGSHYSFDSSLIQKEKCEYVISVGENYYKHPSIRVINIFKKQNKINELNFVNEDKCSKVEFC